MASTIGNIVVNIAADTQQLVKGMKKAQGAVNKSVSVMKKVLLTLGSVAVFDKLISEGFAYNKMMESTTDSIKNLLIATSKNIDENGNLLTLQEKINLAQKEAIGITAELNRINKETPVSLNATAEIYKSMLPSMRQLGVEQADMIEMTKTLAIAGTAYGLTQNQLVSGIDALGTGTVATASDLGRFLSAVGLSNEALKETSDIAGLVQEKLGEMAAGDTMTVAQSNFSESWKSALGEVTKQMFNSSKEQLKTWTKYFNELKKGITFMGELFRSLGNMISQNWDISMASMLLAYFKFVDSVKNMFVKLQNSLKSGVNKIADFFSIGKQRLELKVEVKSEGHKEMESYLASLKAKQKDFNDLLNIQLNITEKTKAANQVKGPSLVGKKTESTIPVITPEQDAATQSYYTMLDGIYTKYQDQPSPLELLNNDALLLQQTFESGLIDSNQYDEALNNLNDQFSKIPNSIIEAQKESIILADIVDRTLATGVTSMFESWINGAKSFGDVMKQMLKDILVQLFKQLVVEKAIAAVRAGFGSGSTVANANGNAFSNGSVTAFAAGGVVNGPTYFPMAGANQTGLMGEAGPEAIMPLQRGRDGKLGVTAKSSPVNVTINNNAPATEVQTQQDDNGNIEIIINKIVDDISRGTGPIGSTMESRYGLSKR